MPNLLVLRLIASHALRRSAQVDARQVNERDQRRSVSEIRSRWCALPLGAIAKGVIVAQVHPGSSPDTGELCS